MDQECTNRPADTTRAQILKELAELHGEIAQLEARVTELEAGRP